MNLVRKAQTLCGKKKITVDTWNQFVDVYNQSNDEGEQLMMGDLATHLIRELVAQELVNEDFNFSLDGSAPDPGDDDQDVIGSDSVEVQP
jgi:hypothetical protein